MPQRMLSEGQKEYIRGNIFQPMDKVVQKVAIFDTIDRALLMLNNSLKQLNYDKKQYEARIVIEDLTKTNPKRIVVKIQARSKLAPDDVFEHPTVFRV